MLTYSFIKMIVMIRDNNGIYQDRRKRHEQMMKTKMEGKSKYGGKKNDNCLTGFFAKIKVLFLYDIVPLVKTLPSTLFRISAWVIIFLYLAEFFHGKALLIPFVIFITIPSIAYLTGTLSIFGIDLKKDECLLNSIISMILPVYIDLYSPVSYTEKVTFSLDN